MKPYIVWLIFLTKRVLRKPLFTITLLLIPIMVIGLRFSLGAGDAIMRVAIYTPADKSGNSLATELVQYLVDSSSSAVTFYTCETKEELCTDVSTQKAACGYLVPADLEHQLTNNGIKNRPVITAYRNENNPQSMLIDELVTSGMYEFISFEILDEHVSKKTGQHARDWLKKRFTSYQNTQTFIEFQYADGSENQALSQNNANYLLLPVRGMTAVLIFLAGMIGTLFYYEDKKKNCFVWLRSERAFIIPRMYVIAPVSLAGIVGFFSLLLTGLAGALCNELLTLFLYLFTVITFCDVLRLFLPRMEFYLTAIPFLTGGSLILCPIFANIGSSLTIVTILQKLTPVYYYLQAIHSWREKIVLLIFTSILIGVELVLSKIKCATASANWKRR